MTENNSTANDTTTKVVVSDDGSFFPAMSSWLVDITPDEAADGYARLAAARSRGSRVFTLESRLEKAKEQRDEIRTEIQKAIDEIRDQLKEGNSVTIGDWDDLGAYFAEIPGIDAGPPTRGFTASITITATVDLSGHAPEDLDKGEVANRIRNVLSLIHEFDIVDDSDNDELFEVEQDSSSIDFDAESITISFN